MWPTLTIFDSFKNGLFNPFFVKEEFGNFGIKLIV